MESDKVTVKAGGQPKYNFSVYQQRDQLNMSGMMVTK